MVSINMGLPRLPGAGVWWPETASLAIDFVSGHAMSAGIAAPLADMVTVARNTSRYALNTAGVYDRFGPDTPAITSLGLGIEAAATNLCTYSQDVFSNAWTASSVTRTAGIDDPAGATSAVRLTETASSAVLSRQPITLTSGATYALTSVLRAVNIDWIRLTIGEPSLVASVYVWFNLEQATTGSAATNGAGFGYISHSAQALGNGYVAIHVIFTAPANTMIAILTSAQANASLARANIGGGPGIGGAYDHWNMQLELGAPSSPIMTAALPASRAADILTLTPLPGTGMLEATLGDLTTQSQSLAAPLAPVFAHPFIRRLVAVP